MTDSRDHLSRRHAPDPAGATSATLLGQARAGDSLAWERLAFLYTPLVAWWCKRQGVAPQDVDDVTQEVLAAVAAKLAEFTQGATGSFRSWLFTITRYKIADHYRRIRDRAKAAGGSDAQHKLEAVPEPGADRSTDMESDSERVILLRQAMELLRSEFHARTWEAAWRVTVDGEVPADVAATLAMTVGAVHTAKSRVLTRLRDLLADLLVEDAAGAD